MKFFQRVQDSIYSPAFYAQAPTKSLRRALGYFFLLTFIATALQTILMVPAIVGFSQRVPGYVKSVTGQYPEELQVQIQNGQVTTNVKEPYFVPLKDIDSPGATISGKNLLVIDTKTPFSAAQFHQYNSAAWLTKDTLFYESNRGFKSTDLSKMDGLEINNGLIQGFVELLTPYYQYVTPVGILFVFSGISSAYTFRLFYMLFLALIIWLLAKIFNWNFSYKGAYTVGLYAMTLGILVDILWSLTNNWITFNGFPFMFTILTLGVVILNLTRKPSTLTPTESES